MLHQDTRYVESEVLCRETRWRSRRNTNMWRSFPFTIIAVCNYIQQKLVSETKFWIWVCSGFGFRHTLVARLIGVNRVSRLVGVTREIRVTAKVIRQIIPIRIEYKMWVVKLPIFRPFHYLILARDDKIMKLVNSLLIYSNSN